MSRRVGATISGKRREEVWESANGGLMDAYGIFAAD